jgi:hypothetical protein
MGHNEKIIGDENDDEKMMGTKMMVKSQWGRK